MAEVDSDFKYLQAQLSYLNLKKKIALVSIYSKKNKF